MHLATLYGRIFARKASLAMMRVEAATNPLHRSLSTEQVRPRQGAPYSETVQLSAIAFANYAARRRWY